MLRTLNVYIFLIGYGKIEPQTISGRLFTVIYGFIGVPFTVIIFTNFGRYLQNLERYCRKSFLKYWNEKKLKILNKSTGLISRRFSNNTTLNDNKESENGLLKSNKEEIDLEQIDDEMAQISPLTLVFIVLFYLVNF